MGEKTRLVAEQEATPAPSQPERWKPTRAQSVGLFTVCAALMSMQPLLQNLSKDSEGHFVYSTLSAVVLIETLKLLVAAALLAVHLLRHPQNCKTMLSDRPWKEFATFSVPAAIYAATNNLGFLALLALHPTTTTIIGQSKIIFTGLLFRQMLKRRLSAWQWLALMILVCALAQAVVGAGGVDTDDVGDTAKAAATAVAAAGTDITSAVGDSGAAAAADITSAIGDTAEALGAGDTTAGDTAAAAAGAGDPRAAAVATIGEHFRGNSSRDAKSPRALLAYAMSWAAEEQPLPLPAGLGVGIVLLCSLLSALAAVYSALQLGLKSALARSSP